MQSERPGAQICKVDFPSAEEIIPPNGWDWEYGAGATGSALSEFEVVRIESYQSLSKNLSTLGNNKEGILSPEDLVAYNVSHTDKKEGFQAPIQLS